MMESTDASAPAIALRTSLGSPNGVAIIELKSDIASLRDSIASSSALYASSIWSWTSSIIPATLAYSPIMPRTCLFTLSNAFSKFFSAGPLNILA